MPDDLWQGLGQIADSLGLDKAKLVREAARFRCNYAKAAKRAGSSDPKDVFAADPRLLDDLQRWHNGDVER